MNKLEAVKEFMQKAGQEVPLALSIPDMRTMLMRHSLIREEAHELFVAIDSVYAMDTLDHLEQVADAIADLLYVTYGAAVAWGIDIDTVFEAVHNANMKKFGPGSYKREDGKWMKPPDWQPPDIKSLLQKMQADFANA